MIFPISFRKCTIFLAATLFLLSSSATSILAQHTPELVPRPGERRYNANVFKASHNAFEKPEEYYEQIDDMNVWSLELDLFWQDDQFEVHHDNCWGRNMNEHVGVMAQSKTWSQKVTLLWLQINGPCTDVTPAIYEAYLQRIIDRNFGWSRVYTAGDFHDIDGGKWPSWQEMVRRGKNLIIVTERGTPYPYNRWFFEVTYTKPTGPPTSQQQSNNQVFFNTGEYRDFPLAPSDYWASRMYPDRWCGQIVGPAYETEHEWNVHVNTRATLVATNCLDTWWTQGSTLVHPPQPTFVNYSETGYNEQYGTMRFPYRKEVGLYNAVNRVSQYGTSTDLLLIGGDFYLTPAMILTGNRLIIGNPMVLKSAGGSLPGILAGPSVIR